ncbi:MAG: hypothetical protein SXU28_00025 [Pseudomonadota bacterium]|nr:hypothetical protein [Pseudomonadota bacterium]
MAGKAIIALMLLLQPAQPQDQFDLICTGTQKTEAGGPARPYEERLRIDLRTGQFCRGECGRIERFYDVNALSITLANERKASGTSSMFVRKTTINRRSGQYRHRMIDGRTLSYSSVDAMCELAEFTPFPEIKF